MSDRSSRPHHSPRRTSRVVEVEILRLRDKHKIGPLRIAGRVPVTASTVHQVLRRHHRPRLAVCDRATGEPVRRYERARPGELVHVDVKKLGRIPDGGGHRVLGRAACTRQPDPRRWPRIPVPAPRPRRSLPTGLHRDPARRESRHLRRVPPAGACLVRRPRCARRASARRQRLVLPQEHLACESLRIGRRFTRPWRPQTNGKVERFHRTLLDEWAYQQPYRSETERQAEFGDWLDWYNFHRPHTGIRGATPADRVTNLSGSHN